MAKRRDDLTIDMWTEFKPPEVAVQIEPDVTKGGTLDVKIARALSHAMAGMDRKVIAVAMSEYLGGQRVSKTMLDQYSSPARADHKITLERLIALVAVTGCHDLLGFVADFSDFAVVPKKYLAVIEMFEVDDFLEKATKYRSNLEVRVKGLRR